MKLQLVKATTSYPAYIFIQDSSSTTGAGLTGLLFNSAGLVGSFVRPLAARVAVTLVTQTVTGVYSSGGFVEVDATNMPGIYRFDPPNAALATGVDAVVIMLKGATNMAPLSLEIQLTDIDLNDAVRGGMTALPNAAADAAGGLPISDAGGLALDTKLANTNEVTAARMAALTDWINGGRLDLLLDAIPTTAMRGTDNAALASVATEARLAELDAANLPATTDGIPTVAEFNARTLVATSYFDPVLDTVALVTDVSTKTGYSLSTAGILAVWHQLTSAIVTAGSIGKLLKDNINATISSRMAEASINTTGGAVDTVTTATTTTTNTDMRGTDSALLASTFSTLFAGITSLAEWLGLMAGKQAGNATALTEVKATGAGAGTYDESSDSLQAIRDRGDASWITGGGGGITDILNLQLIIPTSIDLANTATVRLGLMLTNALDDLPSTAEITPGTISVERKAIGGTSWSAVVTNGACSEQAGLVFFDEVFDSGTGYAEGDSIRVTFKSQKITVAANDYEVTDANGVMFQTEIRQTMRGTDGVDTAAMRGTDGANTVTPPTVAEFNARTLVAALYFDPASDTVATVTTVTNKTGFSLASTGLDAIVSTATGMVEIAKAIWDRVISKANHNISNSAGKVLRQVKSINIEGVAQAGAAGTITLAAGSSSINDFLKECYISLVGGTGANQTKMIVAYNGTTKVAEVHANWLIIPDATSEYEITGRGMSSLALINADRQSLLDLKDFVDDGYDPATNKVEGVKLTDTTTTNTDMRGTEGALTDKAGFSLSTAGILAIWHQLTSVIVTASSIGKLLKDNIDVLVSSRSTPADITARSGAIQKNAAFSNFEVLMVLTSDHVTPATGKTVTAERSIDAGAFAAVAGTIAEVSNGIYQFDALAADTNGNVVTWKFSATDCDDQFVTFRTVP